MSGCLRRWLLVTIVLILPSACASMRQPVPPGTIPAPKAISESDRAYGAEVLYGLRENYAMCTDSQKLTRVERVIDRISKAAGSSGEHWFTFLFEDESVKNAAATRGNYIFVWTGILSAAKSDAEVATILSHEMAHVLAQHTMPTAREQVNEIIVGAAEVSAKIGVNYIPGPASAAADLAGMLASELMKALIVNPERQALEYEADQIGLFLMASAGYDPEAAVEFWTRAGVDPAFSQYVPGFLSSHPDTAARSANLQKYLPAATELYQRKNKSGTVRLKKNSKSPPAAALAPGDTFVVGVRHKPNNVTTWVVAEENVPIYSEASTKSSVVGHLKGWTIVTVKKQQRRWLEIHEPLKGFVQSKNLAPEN